MRNKFLKIIFVFVVLIIGCVFEGYLIYDFIHVEPNINNIVLNADLENWQSMEYINSDSLITSEKIDFELFNKAIGKYSPELINEISFNVVNNITKENVAGAYNYSDNSIILRTSCLLGKCDFDELNIHHEIGHHLTNRLSEENLNYLLDNFRTLNTLPKPYVSSYAKTTLKEDVAETWAWYKVNGVKGSDTVIEKILILKQVFENQNPNNEIVNFECVITFS